MNLIHLAENLLKDKEEHEGFITGGAGTGKTTKLQELIPWLEEQRITYMVVAYTHKAKEVLESKLPAGTPIKTLHSWLKKRPTINSKATNTRALLTSSQFGQPEWLQLLVVDEFSFVGEDDYMSIGDLQDELNLTFWTCNECNYTLKDDEEECPTCRDSKLSKHTIPPLKVLYSGDLNQLKPVKGASAVYPHDPYHIHLTKVWRAEEGLQPTLTTLTRMIEGEIPAEPLKETGSFHRDTDIVNLYKNDTGSKILLAYTNRTVEELNAKIQGRTEPKVGDKLYCPTMRTYYTFNKEVPPHQVQTVWIPGDKVIKLGDKYKPLEFLQQLPYVKFYEVEWGFTIACIMGSYQNKLIRDRVGQALVEKNKQQVDSKKQYREYKCLNDLVCVIDFAHCLTIHKSQGQEFDNVYLDVLDLSLCFNESDMLSLAYVAISRARKEVFTN